MSVNGVLQASGNTLTSMILTITSQWVIQIPLAFILSKYTSLGLNGIWFAFPITNIVMSVIAIWVFRKGKWKKKNITEEEKSEKTINQNANSEEIIPVS
jgi:Na+-driven multidrug efflux pump